MLLLHALPSSLRPTLRHHLRHHLRHILRHAPLSTNAAPAPPPHPPPPSSPSSINPDEVSHFNALASTWWDPYGPSRLLHLMNPLRHSFLNALPAAAPRRRFLDIGCGGGIFAESAARLPGTTSVLGIDPSPRVLAVARAHALLDPALAGKLAYENVGVEALALPGAVEQLADVVSLFEVVEHVRCPAPFLRSCLPFVRPGGWLVGSTIARSWVSWLVTKLVAEDVLRIVPRGTHDWAQYINEGELRDWFAGLEGWGEVRCMGVIYIPGLGWREARGSEKIGNYFFGVRKDG
ncbi:MAG: Hexaprenyldihydroxybenzoate methyltransferase, mitochondrial [Trizodia sp. TS-e1964]|nr:MAG: Hexaprenyldihydroxybenzoate methyltransferase, mitochondrial [Trizodia sp. TS-e1964]